IARIGRRTAQVNACQSRRKRRGCVGIRAHVLLESIRDALIYVSKRGIRDADKIPGNILLDAWRIESGIGDAEVEILGEKSVLKRGSCLYVVPSLHIGKVRAQARIGELPVLHEGFRQIRKRVSTGIVIEAVVPDECTRAQQLSPTKKVRPTGRDILGLNLRALILIRGRRVERIRLLEPGARVTGIQ